MYDEDRTDAERCVEAGVEVAAQHTTHHGLRFRDLADAERARRESTFHPHRLGQVGESDIEDIAEALDLTIAEARAILRYEQ